MDRYEEIKNNAHLRGLIHQQIVNAQVEVNTANFIANHYFNPQYGKYDPEKMLHHVQQAIKDLTKAETLITGQTTLF